MNKQPMPKYSKELQENHINNEFKQSAAAEIYQQQCHVCQNQFKEIPADSQSLLKKEAPQSFSREIVGASYEHFTHTRTSGASEQFTGVNRIRPPNAEAGVHLESKLTHTQTHTAPTVQKSNYINECNQDHDQKSKNQCLNGRYVQTSELISKSQYRTIYRGYDNDSGCEIAWCVYPLKQLSEEEIKKMSQVLDNIINVRHQYILMCSHYHIKLVDVTNSMVLPAGENSEINQSVSPNQSNQSQAQNHDLTLRTDKQTQISSICPQLILVTELITAGSIREYIKQIRLPRLIVIKNWCYKILQGLEFLHKNELVHGKLTCESIYINSNNGDIKIGDLGIRQIPLFNSKQSEIHQSILLKNEKKTCKYDVYCFGLVLLEMISSDVQVPHAFKYLCKLINQGYKDSLINMIEDDWLRDILQITLNDNPECRWSVADLQNHQFFQKSESDHKAIQLKPEFTILVKKVYDELHHQMQQSQSQNVLSSPSRSHQKGGLGSFGSPSSTAHQEALLCHGVHPPDQPGQTKKESKQLILNQSYQSSMIEEAHPIQHPDRLGNVEKGKSKTNTKKQLNARKLANQRPSVSQVYQLKQPNSESQDFFIKAEMIQNQKKEELKMSSAKRKKSHHNYNTGEVAEHQIVKTKKDSAEKLKETLDNTLPAKQEDKIQQELQSQHGASQSLWSQSQSQSMAQSSLLVMQVPQTNIMNDGESQKSEIKELKPKEEMKKMEKQSHAAKNMKYSKIEEQPAASVPAGQAKEATIKPKDYSKKLASTTSSLNCSKKEVTKEKKSANVGEHEQKSKTNILKFFIKLRLGNKKYEIDFKYDVERDNPQKIANEMKEYLHLPQEKIDAVKRQLERLVQKNIQEQNIEKDAQKRKEGHIEAKKSENKSKVSKEGKQQEVIKKPSTSISQPPERSSTGQAAKEVLASTESSPELIKKRRKEMRDKSNNISTLAKNLNIEGSSMEPIKEEKSVLANLDNSKSEQQNKSKSNRSLHEVSIGMLLPNIQSKVNQTVNYEIYNGNEKDKFNCPQNNQLVNKKEFVYSVQYPHHALNLSHIGSVCVKSKHHTVDKKLQRPKLSPPNKAALSAAANLKENQPHLCLTSGANTALGCYTTSLGAIAAMTADARDVLENENDRKELIHLIETIPDIDLSQFPDENFLHQAIPEFQTYQVQYHQKQEQEYQKNLKDGTHNTHKFNETLLEFDHNLDLLHFYGQGSNQIQHTTQHNKNLPFICDEISIILPQSILTTQNQNSGAQAEVKQISEGQQHNQSVYKPNTTYILCDQYILEQLGQCLNSALVHNHQTQPSGSQPLNISSKQSNQQTTTQIFHFESSLAPVLEFQEQNLTATNQNSNKNIQINSTTTTAGASKDPPNAMHFKEGSSNDEVNQMVQPKPQTKKEASSSAKLSHAHLPITTMTNSFKEKVFKHSQIRKLQVQKSQQQDNQVNQQQNPQGSSLIASSQTTKPMTPSTLEQNAPASTPQLHMMGGGTGGTTLAALQNSSNSHSLSNMSAIVQNVGANSNTGGNTGNVTCTNITSQNISEEHKV